MPGIQEIVKSLGLDFSAEGKGKFRGLEAVVYRLNTNVIGAEDPLGNDAGGDWEVADNSENENFLGASATSLVTVGDTDDGVFEFQQTGYFIIVVGAAALNPTTNDRSIDFDLFVTDSGAAHGAGGWTSISRAIIAVSNNTENNTHASGTFYALIKTTSTPTDNRFYIEVGPQSGTTQILGNANVNRTYVVVVKLADL